LEDVIGYLIAIGVILYLLTLLIVYVILPIAGILLGIGVVLLAGISAVGFVSGILVGMKNFFQIVLEAHQRLP